MIWPADYTLTAARNGGSSLIAGFLDSHCLVAARATKTPPDFCLCVLSQLITRRRANVRIREALKPKRTQRSPKEMMYYHALLGSQEGESSLY
jgi:hypothetical protein